MARTKTQPMFGAPPAGVTVEPPSGEPAAAEPPTRRRPLGRTKTQPMFGALPAGASPAPGGGATSEAESERRGAAKRTRLQTEVSLSSESNFYSGFTGDLSETGLFVATWSTLLPAGTAVEVALKLPGRPTLSLAGTVRWVRDSSDRASGAFPGMGIAFDALDAEDLEAIRRFLTAREPMFWSE